MSANELKKTFLDAPPSRPQSRWLKLQRILVTSMLSPAYWLLAHQYRTPGLQIHAACARLGLWLMLWRRAPLSLGWAHHLIFAPLDSTRYFEFDFMWRRLAYAPIQYYLDVSSPRLFPILLLGRRPRLTAELINPDKHDLATTAQFVAATGLTGRCHLHDCLILAAPFVPETFDVITSMSVVEHIPHDTQAIQKMWALLKPGGRLLVSVPCAAQASEQYINHNEYGLLETDTNGYVFWQRFYDPGLLRDRIFSVTGEPHTVSVYGEKIAGAFQKNAARKRADSLYPYWREAYMMGREYMYFKNVEALPGEGVIAMEFVKP